MLLAKVEAEYFDFEAESADSTLVHRQLRLHFADAPVIYISWTARRQHGPESPAYSVDFSSTSFCDDAPAAVVDASATPLWSRLVGHEVALEFVDDDCQILRVGTAIPQSTAPLSRKTS